jgi:hypothetical protein
MNNRVVAPKIFIPNLDVAQEDILTTPEKMVDYLLSFVCGNPGNTSELNEDLMGSLGKIHMENGENSGLLAAEYTAYFQRIFDTTFGSGTYFIDVLSVKVSDIEFRLEIRVQDSSGTVVYKRENAVSKLLEIQNGTNV